MSKSAYSSREGEKVSEGGSPIPPQISYYRLQKGNNEKSLKTRPAPSLRRRRNKPINQGKKKNNKRYSSKKTFLIPHC
jgi:hypothetical protein